MGKNKIVDKYGYFISKNDSNLNLKRDYERVVEEYENINNLLSTMKVNDVGFDEMVKTRNLLSIKVQNCQKKVDFKRQTGKSYGNPIEARYPTNE